MVQCGNKTSGTVFHCSIQVITIIYSVTFYVLVYLFLRVFNFFIYNTEHLKEKTTKSCTNIKKKLYLLSTSDTH